MNIYKHLPSLLAAAVIAQVFFTSMGLGITLLHEFAGGGSDGSYPYGSLTGPNLYGMTTFGGDSNLGVIFYTGHALVVAVGQLRHPGPLCPGHYAGHHLERRRLADFDGASDGGADF